MATSVFKTLEALATEKEAIRQREQEIVAGLREALGRLGYGMEQVAANGTARRGTPTSRRRSLSSRAKPLTWADCGRTFALPLHLGRHRSTMHPRPRTSVPASRDGMPAEP